MLNMKIPNSTKPALGDSAVHTPSGAMVGNSLLPLMPCPLGRLNPHLANEIGPLHALLYLLNLGYAALHLLPQGIGLFLRLLEIG